MLRKRTSFKLTQIVIRNAWAYLKRRNWKA